MFSMLRINVILLFPGDRVMLTSTDYDWQQAEEAVVVHCSDCSNKELRVDCK